MKYLKIINISDQNGIQDYKGLNSGMFIPNSYVEEIYNNTLYVATKENTIPQHTELIELTEEQYINIISIINSPNIMKIEIQKLKADKITLAQNVLDLTTIVEALLTGGIK